MTPLLHIIEQYNQLNWNKEDQELLGDRGKKGICRKEQEHKSKRKFCG
jgi:hypothetical protein